MGHAIQCVPTLRSTQRIVRLCMWRTALRIISGCCRKTLNSSIILCCSSLMFWGGVANTLFLRYPHIKKSQGVKSGERGGHSTLSCSAITRFCPKTSLRRPDHVQPDNVLQPDDVQPDDVLERRPVPTRALETLPLNADC